MAKKTLNTFTFNLHVQVFFHRLWTGSFYFLNIFPIFDYFPKWHLILKLAKYYQRLKALTVQNSTSCISLNDKLCDCFAVNTASLKTTTVNPKLHNHNYDLRRSQLKPCCPRTKHTIQSGCEVEWNVSLNGRR